MLRDGNNPSDDKALAHSAVFRLLLMQSQFVCDFHGRSDVSDGLPTLKSVRCVSRETDPAAVVVSQT